MTARMEKYSLPLYKVINYKPGVYRGDNVILNWNRPLIMGNGKQARGWTARNCLEKKNLLVI